MPGETTLELPGFEPTTARYDADETEKAVVEAINAIEAERPITRSQIALKSLCIALARNIDRGNAKGRAIANEASTLSATLQLLEGEDLALDTDNLPPDAKALLDALGTRPAAPRPDATPAGDPAQP